MEKPEELAEIVSEFIETPMENGEVETPITKGVPIPNK